MSTAQLAVPGVKSPLQYLWRWLVPASKHSQQTPAGMGRRAGDFALPLAAVTSHRVRAEPNNLHATQTHRPLRIVRVLEAGQGPAHVGRMVISGRMADVCAELDRLAALH
jgi:hypothetical protein